MANRKYAQMAAALLTCETLHQCGELDDHLLPVGKEALRLELEDDNDEEWLDGKARPGSTKRRQYYDKKIAEALMNACPGPGEDAFVHVFKLTLSVPAEGLSNPKNRRCVDPAASNRCFGLLSKKPIPEIPKFPLYTRQGEFLVEIITLSTKVTITEEQLGNVAKFHAYLFSHLLRLDKYSMRFYPARSPYTIFVVPLLKDSSENLEIDWPFLVGIVDVIPKLPRQPTIEERQKYTFQAEKFRDAIVLPWYRNIDQPLFYYVAEVISSSNPCDPFPDEEFKSFNEYFMKKYKLQIYQQDQPLLDVDYTSNRLNLLTPRHPSRRLQAMQSIATDIATASIANGMTPVVDASAPATATQPQASQCNNGQPVDPLMCPIAAGREIVTQKQILIPELVDIHPIPASLWNMIICLPSIIYRLNHLLIANEFRILIEKEAFGKEANPPDSSEIGWESLKFTWLSRLPTDFEGDDDEPTRHSVGFGKSIHSRRRKGDQTVNKSAIVDPTPATKSDFEIGVWDPCLADNIIGGPGGLFSDMSNLQLLGSFGTLPEAAPLVPTSPVLNGFSNETGPDGDTTEIPDPEVNPADPSASTGDPKTWLKGMKPPQSMEEEDLWDFEMAQGSMYFDTSWKQKFIEASNSTGGAAPQEAPESDTVPPAASASGPSRVSAFTMEVFEPRQHIVPTGWTFDEDTDTADGVSGSGVFASASGGLDSPTGTGGLQAGVQFLSLGTDGVDPNALLHDIAFDEQTTLLMSSELPRSPHDRPGERLVQPKQNGYVPVSVTPLPVGTDPIRSSPGTSTSVEYNGMLDSDPPNSHSNISQSNDLSNQMDSTQQHQNNSGHGTNVSNTLEQNTDGGGELYFDDIDHRPPVETIDWTSFDDASASENNGEIIERTENTENLLFDFQQASSSEPSDSSQLLPSTSTHQGPIICPSDTDLNQLLGPGPFPIPKPQVPSIDQLSTVHSRAPVLLDDCDEVVSPDDAHALTQDSKLFVGIEEPQLQFEDKSLSSCPYGPSPSTILQALTMSNANDGFNLERLETVGDSFLKYAITIYLFKKNPEKHEGKLSFLRSKQVSNYNLYRLGKKKNIGDVMVAVKFEPNDNWLPPGYAPLGGMRAENDGAEEEDKEMDEVLEGKVDEQKYYEKMKNTTDPKTWYENSELAPVPYNLLTQHSVPDKSIADAVEALIGAYLLTYGPEGALRFMQWLGLHVLPSDRDASFNAPEPLLHFIPQPLSLLHSLWEKHNFGHVEEILHYSFRNKAYLLQAFTHASYYYNRVTDCYQRLEFLGDAVLDYLITRHLYQDERQHSPGVLTDLRSALVNNTIFASLGIKYKFHKFFLAVCPGLYNVIEKFVKLQSERQYDFNFDEELYLLDAEDDVEDGEDIEVPKAIGDIFESVAGAIFLDSGESLDAVWRVYYTLMKEQIEKCCKNPPKSPIRELLEMEPETAKFSKAERLVEQSKVRVTVEVVDKGRFVGLGRNYRIAKCTAAKRALKYLKALERQRKLAHEALQKQQAASK